ncbi:hypothetical protein HN371_29185 [Candidatus Poribacteria bacterium]|jgi:hypothetical protein|nr:hypothetical protein [Candidatus Poribacteria bacterium]MBT7100667.1 hypothetical protein [Candidatus Poribacteria bacterium]MBT7808870.1 hypothetical protein [Candidatus Poribacteria bacterium]
MRHRDLARHAFIHAAIASIYIGLVGLLFYSGQDVLKTRNGPLAVTAYLLLVVLSAAFIGVAVFGKAAMWYVDGRRSDAVSLALYTVGFLSLITAATFLVLLA